MASVRLGSLGRFGVEIGALAAKSLRVVEGVLWVSTGLLWSGADGKTNAYRMIHAMHTAQVGISSRH